MTVNAHIETERAAGAARRLSARKVVVSLMGGLGNQMFQYAAARAMAHRNGAELVLDTTTGFLRDKIYKRHYELGSFPIKGRRASLAEQLPFWIERLTARVERRGPANVTRRPWGAFLSDASNSLVGEAFDAYSRPLFVRGYWPSEAYFADVRNCIGRELRPPRAASSLFADMARRIAATNSVAVGVRLFEEVPGTSKAGVGGVVAMASYNAAAHRLAETIDRPEFFVFCTAQSPALAQLTLPGPVHFVTHDNGFTGTTERLWLLSHCRNHIISNSTFYWWGAWLAEFERPETKVVAIGRFLNKDAIPGRWIKIVSGHD